MWHYSPMNNKPTALEMTTLRSDALDLLTVYRAAGVAVKLFKREGGFQGSGKNPGWHKVTTYYIHLA